MHYRGYRTTAGYLVQRSNGTWLLPVSQGEASSIEGFEWGRRSAGTLSLAYTLLADVLGEVAAADLYQPFGEEWIARLPDNGVGLQWEISADWVGAWVRTHAATAIGV
jgi:hypothetical protein